LPAHFSSYCSKNQCSVPFFCNRAPYLENSVDVVEYTLFNAGIASFQPTEQCFVFLTFRTAASVVTD
ncbi:hypothetical protein, partial [Flavonifractor plautii]|uniref:hypothetical protein n=1 Tax=Flavonifractor plautii TaxID=292800 RepID=UPI001A9AEFB5